MQQRVIGALQVGSDLHGTAATLDKILAFEPQIRQSGCDLLVMPEALLGGYPKGADFGTRVGYRTAAGREEFLQYWRQAVDLDGAEVAAVAGLAKACNSAIVIGVVERSGTTLFCTALFFSNNGELLAKHRKLMPTASERLIWGLGDGSTIPVVETAAGRVGAAICWENYMPLLRTAMYAKGIEIWCAPTVDDRDIWQTSMSFIAYEGRNFLVSACQYQPAPTGAARRDAAWPDDKPLIRGGSVVVSPMGAVLAGPVYGCETLVVATIDLDDIVKARFDMDPTGHYSRPDIFRLSLDERERPQFSGPGADPELES